MLSGGAADPHFSAVRSWRGGYVVSDNANVSAWTTYSSITSVALFGLAYAVTCSFSLRFSKSKNVHRL
jgi:hypothetical protein